MKNLTITLTAPGNVKWAVYLGTSLLLIALLSSCQSSAQSPEYRTVTNEELVTLLKDESVQLLDVRTPEEVAQGVIAGAGHIDIYDPEFDNKLSQLDRTRPVAVYCAAGGRSAKAQYETQGIGVSKNI